MPRIIHFVSREFHIADYDITGSRKYTPYMRARLAVILIARAWGHTFTQIAHSINRHHTTVSYDYDKAVQFAKENPEYRAACERVLDRAAVELYPS